VYARFLLFHLADPTFTLKKMYEMTKPGGSIIVQDHDYGTWGLHSALSDTQEEIRRTFFSLCEKTRRDLNIGFRLPSLFVQAGIGLPDGTRVEGRLTPLTGMALRLYQSVLPRALKLGITTEEASKAIIQKAKIELDDKTQYGLWPLCIGVWKRKPA
jgi:hypothetical protein